MLSVSRAPHRDNHAAQGARLTLSLSMSHRHNLRLRRLTRALAAGYQAGEPLKAARRLTRALIVAERMLRGASLQITHPQLINPRTLRPRGQNAAKPRNHGLN